ncbi:MAG: VOC family protein [Pseudomonadota bacterium]
MNSPKDLASRIRELAADVEDVAVRFDTGDQQIIAGSGEPQATLKLSQEALERLISGDADATAMFMSGELKIDGDMAAAVQFGKAFESAPDDTTQIAETARETNDNILYLDNIGLIVLDLDTAGTVYQNLGFNIAPRGTHYYQDRDGNFNRWGTANHCVNFRDGGLLEFIGHYYADYPAGLYSQQLKVYGNHWGKITLHNRVIVEEVQRLRKQGHRISDPSNLYRYTDGETFDPDPTRSKKTVMISYPTSFEDPFMTTGAEHTIGQWPISDEHFNHPNGTQSIAYALIGATDLDATVARYEEATSIKSESHGLGRRINLGRDTFLYLISQDALPGPLAQQFGDRTTIMLGGGLRVQDIEHTRSWLKYKGISATEDELGLSVYEPVKGSGAIIFLNA